MAILTKGQTFANADDVTSTKLNNLVDAAAFVTGSSGTTDDSSLEVNGSGRLQVKDLGITSAKLAASGVTYAKIQNVTNMRVLGNVSGSAAAPSEVSILDEDTMSSDSATGLATQQSIKAYVDSKGLTRGTAVASTSGTAVTFSSLPATIKKLTMVLNGVSTNGTSGYVVTLGDSGGLETSGYIGSNADVAGATPVTGSSTTNMLLSDDISASATYSGTVTLYNVSGNIWVATTILASSNGVVSTAAYNKTLTGTLDRISLTTAGGVNTFDAGSVNVFYE